MLALTAIVGCVGYGLKTWFDARSAAKEDVVRARSVAETYSFDVNVNDLFVPLRDIRRYDMQEFLVDQERGFIILKPNAKRSRIEEESLSSLYTGLSPSTVPFFGHLVGSIQKLALTEHPEPGDVVTTRLLLDTNVVIKFNERSRFGGVPVGFNPLRNPDVSRATLDMVAGFLGRSDEEISSILSDPRSGSLARHFLGRATSRAIKKRTPEPVRFTPGVTVKSFRKRFLAASPLAAGSSNLSGFGYFVLLQMINPELAAFALSKLDVSRDGNVFLYDSTLTLHDVEVGETGLDTVELVKLFLIIEGRWYVHAIRLQYLNGLISSREEDGLEDLLRSVRVVR